MYAAGGLNEAGADEAALGVGFQWPSGWQRYEALPEGRFGEGVLASFQNPRELGETLTVFAAPLEPRSARSVKDVWASPKALADFLQAAAPQQEVLSYREAERDARGRVYFEVVFNASAITAGPYGSTFEWRKYVVDPDAKRLMWIRATATLKRYYRVRPVLQQCVDSFKLTG